MLKKGIFEEQIREKLLLENKDLIGELYDRFIIKDTNKYLTIEKIRGSHNKFMNKMIKTLGYHDICFKLDYSFEESKIKIEKQCISDIFAQIELENNIIEILRDEI